MNKYKSASAFLSALNERLKSKSLNEGIDIQRLRRQVAFDRLLQRLFYRRPSPWVLKGGYAMELRTTNPRATKDIDIVVRETRLMSHNSDEQNSIILNELRECANIDLGDFFLFQIEDPTMNLEAAPYGGARFPVTVLADGRLFIRFSLDVAVGDPLIEPLDSLKGESWLSFANLPSEAIPALSKEQQFAEKLHAYTLPRDGRINSRVKDLIDMLLLLKDHSLSPKEVKAATEVVFNRRKTHSLPGDLLRPPDFWQEPFNRLAGECKLQMTINDGFETLTNYFKRLISEGS